MIESSPSPSSAKSQPVGPTSQRIGQLLAEIAALAESELSAEAFAAELLPRVVAALAAHGAALWTLAGRELRLDRTSTSRPGVFEPLAASAEHRRLLEHVSTAGARLLMQPRSRLEADSAAANPSEQLLLVAPFDAAEGSRGVLEVVQRAETSAAAQAGYLQFVEDAARAAETFYRRSSSRGPLAEPAVDGAWVAKFLGLVRAAHESLDPRTVAYQVANEGRLAVGCDRLSVVVRQGSRWRVLATSGQDVIDARSTAARSLAGLVAAAATTGEGLSHPSASPLRPPQVEAALDGYLEAARVRACTVELLRAPADASLDLPDTKRERPIVGALVADMYQAPALEPDVARRLTLVGEQAASAVHNAQQYAAIPLRGMWQTLGQTRGLVAARNLPKTVAVGVLLAAGIAALVFVPAELTIEARGRLEPVTRREAFARTDGVIDKVLVAHGDTVKQGQVLVELRSSQLDYQLASVLGDLQTTIKKLTSAQASLLTVDRGSAAEKSRYTQLAAEIEQLTTEREGLQKQYDLLVAQQSELRVTSPIAGQVATWDVTGLLAARPVERGQSLVTVADVAGPWHLELDVPDRRIGHVLGAREALGPKLGVSFILATDPAQTLHGEVAKVALDTEVTRDNDSAVRVDVDLDRAQLRDPRPGATVIAKIDCGRRSLGYVWFRELIEFVESKILFRLG